MQTLQIAPGGRKTKKADIVLLPHAWIKFHVKNVNPVDENDLIIAPGASGADLNYQFWGKMIDTTYVDKGYTGNVKNNIKWYITKNGIFNAYNDSLYLKALDTTFYEIKY